MTTERELFDRVWSLRLGTLDVSELDFEADISKSTKREPNKCTLTVYNLASEHRADLAKGLEVEVHAGYRRAGGTHLRFAGAVKKLDISRNDVDVVTKLECEDAGDSYRRARVNRSFSAGTSIEVVVRALAESLGVGAGNLEDWARGLALEDSSTVFPNGFVVSGSAPRELTRVLRSAGLRWSVQNGVLQIRERGKPVRTTAVRLAPDSGLIGSPTIGEKGKVTVEALLPPDVYPGAIVVVESDQLSGQYTVTAMKDALRSRGTEWKSSLELTPY